jgi:hypothetical protein
VIEIYKKRKYGCIDMIEFLSEHLNEDFDSIILLSGIDSEDLLDNPEVNQILGIEEVRLHTDGDEDHKVIKEKLGEDMSNAAA